MSKRKGNKGEDEAANELRSHGCTVWNTAPNRGLCRSFDDLVCWPPDKKPSWFWAESRDSCPHVEHIEVKRGSSFSLSKIYNTHDKLDRPLGSARAPTDRGCVLWTGAGIVTGSAAAWLRWVSGGEVDCFEVEYKFSDTIAGYVPRDGALLARHPRKSWIACWHW
jgi:hypothetical protein